MAMKESKPVNDKYTRLPREATKDCDQGAYKVDLPTSSKYGKK